MSRRSKGSSGVRGPSSALTEFLRVEGITDAFRERQNREANPRSGSPSSPETGSPQAQESALSGTQELSPSPARTRRSHRIGVQNSGVDEEEEIRQAARRKRRAARTGGAGSPGDSGSDDDDDDDFNGSNDDADDDDELNNDIKQFGDEDECADCGDLFKLTVYSRFDANKNGYLCEACNEKLKKRERNARRSELNARKKRKKMAEALLNKSSVKIPKLQDICIKKITQNINDVEVLGDIGQVNLNKISRILSKNRSLDNSTMTLFLNPALKSLEFWDCSNVDSDSLNKIASYCPNLESLTLFMCGQLHNDNISYYSSNLPHLTSLALNGPFLISDTMWQEYFEGQGKMLQKFEIRNTHRFGNDSLISLLENCGSKLTLLKLSHLDGIDSLAVYDLIPHYLTPSQLTHLEISYPHRKDLVTDDLLINLLSITGESLISLNVDGCSDLTDSFLIDGLAKFCPNLTDLSLRDLDSITDQGFSSAFLEYRQVNSGGLINVDLTKCIDLGDKGIHSLLSHSGHTLIELSLNSCYNITKDFLIQIFTDDLDPDKQALKEAIENGEENNDDTLENKREFYSSISLSLLTKWDLGFVRAVDDDILSLISDNCSKLSIVEVYGDNRCGPKANTRKDLIVIGRQHDTI